MIIESGSFRSHPSTSREVGELEMEVWGVLGQQGGVSFQTEHREVLGGSLRGCGSSVGPFPQTLPVHLFHSTVLDSYSL